MFWFCYRFLFQEIDLIRIILEFIIAEHGRSILQASHFDRIPILLFNLLTVTESDSSEFSCRWSAVRFFLSCFVLILILCIDFWCLNDRNYYFLNLKRIKVMNRGIIISIKIVIFKLCYYRLTSESFVLCKWHPAAHRIWFAAFLYICKCNLRVCHSLNFFDCNSILRL